MSPKVCIEIDEIANKSQWLSVIANGTYQELPEPRYEADRAHACRLLEERSRWWLNALAERRTTSRDDSIAPLFFRVHLESVTGLCGRSETEEVGAVPAQG